MKMLFLKSLANTGAGGLMTYCYRAGLDKLLWLVVVIWIIMLAWDLMLAMTPYRRWK